MKAKLFVALVVVLLVATNVAQAGNHLWARCVPKEHEARCRYVEMTLSPEQIHADSVFYVVLFSGTSFKLIGQYISYTNGNMVLTGTIDGDPSGVFFLVDKGDSYWMYIQTSYTTYRVDYIDGTVYRIVQPE